MFWQHMCTCRLPHDVFLPVLLPLPLLLLLLLLLLLRLLGQLCQCISHS
jgi:hypothetical protein